MVRFSEGVGIRGGWPKVEWKNQKEGGQAGNKRVKRNGEEKLTRRRQEKRNGLKPTCLPTIIEQKKRRVTQGEKNWGKKGGGIRPEMFL